MNIESVPARISAIQANIELLSDYLDPVELQREIERLESEMQDPAFWDDQEKAANSKLTNLAVTNINEKKAA